VKARELGYVLKETVKKTANDDVHGLASQAAYAFAFSLFPSLLLVFVIVGIFSSNPDFIGMIEELFAPFLPPQTLSLVTSYLRSLSVSETEGLLSLSVLLTLWPASAVVTAYMKAVNKAYNEKERPFLMKRLVAFLIVLLAGLLVLMAFLFMIFGPLVGTYLTDFANLNDIYKTLFDVLRFPFALLFISSAYAMLYRLAPNDIHGWYEIIPGALLATWAWITVTLAFSIYVENFGSYNETYGTLGGVIIMLTWMYLTSVTVIIGAEFNAAFGDWLRKNRPEVYGKELPHPRHEG
jgi:membrane protein